MSCDHHCDPCAGTVCDCACAGACGTPATLAPPANRAGRDTLRTRIGNHGDFFADALRRLSARDAPALRALGTRDLTDPAIALLDAWSVAADVLTFYRERLTNEAYLRTARSERSLRELASEVGYKPRPGVAATVHLAFLLDASAAPVEIPAGAKTQTVPQPGEQMQTFETDEALQARAEWSMMPPRLTRVPAVKRVDALTGSEFRLNDASLVVRPGERLLFRFGDQQGQQVGREIASARNDVLTASVVLTLKPRPGLTPDLAAKILALTDETQKKVAQDGDHADPKLVQLLEALVSYLLGASAIDAFSSISDTSTGFAAVDDPAGDILAALLTPTHSKPISIESTDIDASLAALETTPEAQLRAPRYLDRKAAAGLEASGATRGALLQSLTPGLGAHLYAAWGQLPGTAATQDIAPDLYLLRSVHSPYGANAPLLSSIVRTSNDTDWTAAEIDHRYAFLDGVNDAVHPDSYALIQTPRVQNASSHTVRFARVIGASTANRGDYSLNSKVTRLELVDPDSGKMLDVLHDIEENLGDLATSLAYLRNTVYAVQSELVTLATEPIADDVGGDNVVLNGLYDGLDVGRWIIVAGERTDITANDVALPGIRDGELAMIDAIKQIADPASPADARHTVVYLRNKLAFTYRRSSVIVYGNVVPASHGETVSEVMGSGDARARLATYTLKRAPLTYVAAPTASGVRGTQIVRVNDVRWNEVDSLLDAAPGQRAYELTTDATGAATAVFGDGIHGARLPTGQDNLRAQFRVGIGRSGNVQPGQITLLSTRPLGVQGVINPLRAAGGADRDGIEQIRRNLPQAVLALSPRSRLVSVQDYAYFAQRFAAIGHAQAAKLADGGASVVYVTLAGVDDIPLDPKGALLEGLNQAFHTYGDPALPVQLGVRELIALVLQAKVAIDTDADWNVVEPRLRARLLDVFSFDRAQLGRSVYLSAAVAAMQTTPGVAWVDVDVFGGISELALRDKDALAAAVAVLEQQASGGAVQQLVACAPAMAAADAPQSRQDQIAQRDGELPRFLPAQMAMLAPDVPGTLVFNLVETEGKSC
ncbi:hypothetical protein RugamoR57_02870 [Duganella caerulea]|uniref:putative baseplate assembly protein n=1 Tax=Duganella caerulea TaxID=2885762 RepID=UPI0030E7ADED